MRFNRMLLGTVMALALIGMYSTVAAQPVASQSEGTAASAAMTEGEVRKVDKDAQKITLRHGPIENLGMPGMTMVFRVKDPTMLDQVKTGDKIRFAAENIGGQLTVIRIDPTK